MLSIRIVSSQIMVSTTALPRNWLPVNGCSYSNWSMSECFFRTVMVRPFLEKTGLSGKNFLGINYCLWSNAKSNTKCSPLRAFQFVFYLKIVPALPIIHILSFSMDKSTLSCVIQYKKPYHLSSQETLFTKLSLFQTFENTELIQPPVRLPSFFFSLKLLGPMPAVLSGQRALQEKFVSINCSLGEGHLAVINRITR